MTGPPAAASRQAGTLCLVLHSHLPWLAHHGTWPVGAEWLYQAWAHSYLPVLDLLERLAAEGRRDVLTLGVTPVLTAQWDDSYCLRGMSSVRPAARGEERALARRGLRHGGARPAARAR